MQDVLGLRHYNEASTASDRLSVIDQAGSYSTDHDENGNERIFRIRQVHNVDIAGTPFKQWAVLTPTGLLPEGHLTLEDQVLLPNKGLRFAYIQDLDGDDMPARLEYLNGC